MATKIVKIKGRIEYHKNDITHRADGPAILWADPSQWDWVLNGMSHRYYGCSSDLGDWTIHGITIK